MATPTTTAVVAERIAATRDQAIADLATALTQLATLEAEAADLAAALPALQAAAGSDYTISGGGGVQSFSKGSLLATKQAGLLALNNSIETWSRKIERLQKLIEDQTNLLAKIQPYQFTSRTR